MKITVKKLNKVNTLEDLEGLNIGNIKYDIGHRGGNLGFSGSDIARVFDISEYDLPKNFGAYCNYLGGGLRGKIMRSDFSNKIDFKKSELLNTLSRACVRVYKSLDDEYVPNDVMEGIARVDDVESAY